MKPVRYFQKKARAVWERVALGHALGPEVTAQVLTGRSIESPAAPVERQH